MQKKVFAIALAAISIFSVSTFALDPQIGAKEKKVECSKEQCPDSYRAQKPDCAQRFTRPESDGKDFFKGIELTAEQKVKVEKLRIKEDSERIKAEAKMKAEREKKMLKHKAEMKKILTEEQYRVFEDNLKSMRVPEKKFKDGKDCKSGKCKDGKDCKSGKCKDGKDCKAKDSK